MLTDRIGTGLLVAGVVGVVAAGLAARPLVVSETEDTERAAEGAPRATSSARGDEELIRNLETRRTPSRLGEDYFRTCIAARRPRRYFCFFIDTSRKRAPDVDVRPERASPNSVYKVR